MRRRDGLGCGELGRPCSQFAWKGSASASWGGTGLGRKAGEDVVAILSGRQGVRACEFWNTCWKGRTRKAGRETCPRPEG
jgi:hypothetical protein